MSDQMKRTNRKAAQRRAFRAYIMKVKSVKETWTGWRKELVLQRQSEELNNSELQTDELATQSPK